MKKTYLLIVSLLYIGFSSYANGTGSFREFSENYTDENIHLHTLLVLKYKFLSIDDPIFYDLRIDREQLLAFIDKENQKIDQYNKGLEELFLSHYEYNFKIIDEKDLKYHDSAEFPYLYKRYIHFEQGQEPYYARFFMNRKEKILFDDIKVNQRGYNHLIAEKSILLKLNKFLRQ